MDRLTPEELTRACNDPWDYCGLDGVCKRDCFKPEPCKIPAMVHHLAAYEDTGLEPEDIKTLQQREEGLAMLLCQVSCNCKVTYTRLRELAEADKDGRCVVLPCKVGDTVFISAWNCRNGVKWDCENEQGCMTAQACFSCQEKCDLHRQVNEQIVDSDLWLISEFCYGHFGKTVFITREAAEKALEAK